MAEHPTPARPSPSPDAGPSVRACCNWPIAQSRARHLLRTLAIGIALGLLVATIAKVARSLPAGGPWWASLGATWFVASFAAGALVRERATGALAGALVIVAGTCGYYLWTLAAWDGGERYVAAMVAAWSTVGVLAGAGFGCAGTVWRRDRSSLRGMLAATCLAGALVGEAILLHLVWTSPWAQRALALELCAGIAAAVVLSTRRRVAALALTLVAAGLFAVAEHATRETLRAAGWVGA